MKLDQLVAGLSAKKGAVLLLQQGQTVRHGFAGLADDVARARADLMRWNVKAGMRVGVFAPNSYAYIVFDLALIDLHAITVPFTDDFAGALDRALVDRYNIALMLLAKTVKHSFTAADDFVAFIDAENGAVSALPRILYANGDVTMICAWRFRRARPAVSRDWWSAAAARN